MSIFRLNVLTGIMFCGLLMIVGCGQNQMGTSDMQVEAILVTPEACSVSVGATQQFGVSGLSVKSASTNPTNISWQVLGGIGTIDAQGLFTATTEGQGTIEARIDTLIGRSTVTVTGGKTVSGTIKSCYLDYNRLEYIYEDIASPAVVAGSVIGRGKNDGSYLLSGLSSADNSISAAAINCLPATVCSSDEIVNVYLNSVFEQQQVSDATEVKGRLLDSNGNPITSVTSLSFQAQTQNSSGGIYSLGADGAFSVQMSVPKVKSTGECFLSAVYEESPGVYKSFIKEITLTRGITYDVGAVTIDEPAVTITGNTAAPGGFSGPTVCCGLENGLFSNYCYIAYAYGSNPYTLHVPPTPTGQKYFLGASASGNNAMAEKYYHDLQFTAGGNYTYDFTISSALNITAPAPDQALGSVTPRFAWDSLGNDFIYIVMVNDYHGVIWTGYTKNNYIDYPFFPAGSGIEGCNFRNGNEYYLNMVAVKIPGLNIADMKPDDLSKYDEYYYCYSNHAFTINVPGAGSSSLSAMASKNTGYYDEKEYLKQLGLPANIFGQSFRKENLMP